MKRTIFLLLLVAPMFVSGVIAQKNSASGDRQIAAKFDQYLRAEVVHEKFMGSVLVARNGKTILNKGYGLANAEFNAPNNPQTVFRLASVTKQFTAAAIMILKERGKLDLGDSVCKYIANCPASWQPVTIRHCLTMTHGIPGISAQEIGALRSLPIPMDQWFETTAKKPLEYVPGEKFRYLNSGYAAIGLIIEKVSGKTYGEFLQENIFTPVGMKRTGYEDPLRVIPNRATGYDQLPESPLTNLPYREIVRFYSAGGVYSTTEDLLLWDQALYGEKILSKQSIDKMFTPSAPLYPGRQYGYGWLLSEKFGRREIAHGGNATGFITYFARYPEDRVTIIVLSNNQRGSAGRISNSLAAIMFGKPYSMPTTRKAIALPAEVLNRYVGKYQVESPPAAFTITNENGKLLSQRDNEGKEELFAESETKFFLKTVDQQFTFNKAPGGEFAELTVDLGDGVIYEYLKGKKTK